MQAYMESNSFSAEEISTLFNLRANTFSGYKMCFPKAYPNNKLCKLGCLEEDSICHLYSYNVVSIQDTHTNVQYGYIFSSVVQQKEAVEAFIKRNAIRSAIIESSAYQGVILGTSTPATAGGARERCGK